MIVCVLSQKGGVGKTTTVINLGAALARQKQKVLLLDLDTQCSLTNSVMDLDREYKVTIRDVIKKERPIRESIYHAANYDFIPSSKENELLEVDLDDEMALSEALQSIDEEYDYILIDCPPNLHMMSLNALFASDGVIVPMEPYPLAVDGLTEMIGIVNEVKGTKREIGKSLEIIGVLLTRYKRNYRVMRKVARIIEDSLPGMTFKAKIRDNVSIPEAQDAGMDIFEYNKQSYGASDYDALAKEILRRIKRRDGNGE